MSAPPVGVLVMAHGTPGDAAEIEAFYTRIRRGRPPSPEQLANLERRYLAIGGVSPLAERTATQVDALASALDRAAPGSFVVSFGAKHTEPFIEDAAEALAATGVSPIVGLVLTPHRSSMGSGEYLRRAAEALAKTPEAPEFVAVEQWFDAPGFADLLAERVLDALDRRPAPPTDGTTLVVFTAHSLPERVLAEGDPYLSQMTDSAALIAQAAKLDARHIAWQVAWQSAGRTADTWIGPDLLDVIRQAPARGVTSVVVCAVGFVADHLEVLFDLDIEATQVARETGVGFSRTTSLNDEPRFIEILADTVRSAADRSR